MPRARQPNGQTSKPDSNQTERVRHELERRSPSLVGSQNPSEATGQQPESSTEPETRAPDQRLSVEPDNRDLDKQSPSEQGDEPPKLTGMKARFFEAYAANHFTNATEAGRIAGIRARTEDTLRQRCSLLSRDPEIRLNIAHYWRTRAMPNEEILAVLSSHVRVDPAQLGTLYVETDHGRRVDWDEARRRGVSRLIKHVSLDRSGNETIEWVDPQRALDLLAKVSGLTSDATNVQVNIDTMSIDELKAIISG